MQKIIAVFGNRNQALQFATALKKLGIKNKTIDTPRELSSSCGISIIFDGQFFSRAKMILARYKLYGSVKLYMITGDLFKKYHYINI